LYPKTLHAPNLIERNKNDYATTYKSDVVENANEFFIVNDLQCAPQGLLMSLSLSSSGVVGMKEGEWKLEIIFDPKHVSELLVNHHILQMGSSSYAGDSEK
jgi:hypothetical protein